MRRAYAGAGAHVRHAAQVRVRLQAGGDVPSAAGALDARWRHEEVVVGCGGLGGFFRPCDACQLETDTCSGMLARAGRQWLNLYT
eukprot:6202393-Pleurochrysis_carterae.AAC.1